MWRLAHLRARAARHPLIYWAFVATLAAIAAHLVLARFDAAEAARRGWGDPIEVLIATSEHRPGDALTTRRVELPASAVPDGVVDELPAGARARQFLSAGAVVELADVATIRGPASGASPDAAVVPIPLRAPAADAVGAPVDVVADGIVLAGDATVTMVDGDTLFVAVARRAAPAVAAAAHRGVAGVVFLP